MADKNDTLYPSLTTPDFFHGRPEFFAAELLVYRHAVSNGEKLPPYFWRKASECSENYKKEYKDSIECIRKILKMGYQAHFVIQCIFYAKTIQYCNYGYIIATIQKRWDTWKKNVAKRFINQVDEMVKSRDIMFDISNATKQYEENGLSFGTTKKNKKINY